MSNWVDEDEVTITYRTLRQSMADAQLAERERIIALLKDDYLLSPEYEQNHWGDTLRRDQLQQIISLIREKPE